MEAIVNKELLQKYFEGNATIFEKKLIDNWANEPKNQEVFYQTLAKYESQNIQFTPDINSALQKHLSKVEIFNSTPNDIPELDIKKFQFSKWAAAAMVIFLMGIGAWLYRDNIQNQTYQTSFGEVKTIQLDDGSIVVLNANSTLKIPRFGFGERSRVVFLDGEAQFNVIHQLDNQPFIVKTSKQFEILVLGTEFNVYTRSRGAKVLLHKGKIQLSYQEGIKKKQVIMKPGELVSIDESKKIEFKIPVETQQFSAWKEHRFIFDETSLEEITHLFEENFGQKIIIENPELMTWTVSGSFTALNANELLETLSEASNLSYRKEGNAVIIFKEK